MLYVNVVANKAVALLTIGVYFLYLALSVWGITRININLSTQKLFTEDSPLLEVRSILHGFRILSIFSWINSASSTKSLIS